MKKSFIVLLTLTLVLLTACGNNKEKEAEDARKEQNLNSLESVATESAVSADATNKNGVLVGDNLYSDPSFNYELAIDDEKKMCLVDNDNNYVQDFTLKVKELDKNIKVQFVDFVPIAIRTDIIKGYSLLECQQSNAEDTTLIYIDVSSDKEKAEKLLNKDSINILSTKDEIGQIKYSDSRDECDYHLIITGKIVEN